MYAPVSTLQFEGLLKSLEVLKNVELAAEEDLQAKERQRSEEAAAAAAAAAAQEEGAGPAKPAAAGGWKKAADAVRRRPGGVAVSFKLDLGSQKLGKACAVLEDEEDDKPVNIDAALVRPVSLAQLFHELQQQEEASKMAPRLERRLSVKEIAKEAAEEAVNEMEEADRRDSGEDVDLSQFGTSDEKVVAMTAKLGKAASRKKVTIDWAGKKRWASTIQKVNGVKSATENLAGLFDEELPSCTPVELLRSFAGLHYVTCKQVGLPPLLLPLLLLLVCA